MIDKSTYKDGGPRISTVLGGVARGPWGQESYLRHLPLAGRWASNSLLQVCTYNLHLSVLYCSGLSVVFQAVEFCQKCIVFDEQVWLGQPGKGDSCDKQGAGLDLNIRRPFLLPSGSFNSTPAFPLSVRVSLLVSLRLPLVACFWNSC